MPKGGARPNSGRPKRNNYKKVSVTLSTEVIKEIESRQMVGEYFSNALERLLKDLFKKEKKKGIDDILN